jgi:hypothetical protein
MKVSELTGSQLDYWVARAEGEGKPYMARVKEDHPSRTAGCLLIGKYALSEVPRHCDAILSRRYSTRWDHGGPLIEREVISIQKDVEDYSEPEEPWYAECGVFWDLGATPLIAAMRAYVKYKFGDEVADL